MPNKDQMTELAAEVMATTKLRGLKWKETADESEFICSFKGNKYLLKVKNYTEFDERGEKVGSPCIELFRSIDDTLLLRITSYDSTRHYDEDFQNLFDMAKDQALGVDQALDEFLDELKTIKSEAKDDDIPR